MGKMLLVVMDAHSKWFDVYPVNICTSIATIVKLGQSFAVDELPETVVTDNGTCFTSDEFSVFTRHHGINRIKSAPYHTSTNSLA